MRDMIMVGNPGKIGVRTIIIYLRSCIANQVLLVHYDFVELKLMNSPA